LDLPLVSPEHPEWRTYPWEVAMKARLTRLAYHLAALAAGRNWH
jgi:hypothetical protein